MKQTTTILLMAIAFSLISLALAATPPQLTHPLSHPSHITRRSRFLASAKKCDNPSACTKGSGGGGGGGGKGRENSCCFGECVDRTSDPSNCGKCGKVCKFTQSCCAGKCVDLAFDKKNCGGCSNKCKKTCIYGLCDYA